MTSRRRFIKLSVASILAVGVGYVGIKTFATFKNVIIDILHADLEGLNIKQGEIEKFALQASQSNPWGFNEKKKKLLALYRSSRNIPLPFKEEYKMYRDEIVSRFLLSTDFFLNKMDERKEIKYTGVIWGPYTTPCINPFSSLFYE